MLLEGHLDGLLAVRLSSALTILVLAAAFLVIVLIYHLITGPESCGTPSIVFLFLKTLLFYKAPRLATKARAIVRRPVTPSP